MNSLEEIKNMNDAIKLSEEEADKLLNAASHAGLEVAFDNYWKYTFHFSGENDVITLSVGFGGGADDIYRYDVDNKPKGIPDNLKQLKEQYNDIRLLEKSTTKQFDYYESL